MHHLFWSAALVLSVLSGCASVQSVRTGPTFAPPRSADCAIEVHSAAPAASFDRVCEIEAPLPYEDSLGAIKKSACGCGADAVVMPSAQSRLSEELTEVGRSRIIGIKYRHRSAE